MRRCEGCGRPEEGPWAGYCDWCEKLMTDQPVGRGEA